MSLGDCGYCEAWDQVEELTGQRAALLTALKKLLPLAAQAWAKHDADATEYYIATRDARAAIAGVEGNND